MINTLLIGLAAYLGLQIVILIAAFYLSYRLSEFLISKTGLRRDDTCH